MFSFLSRILLHTSSIKASLRLFWKISKREERSEVSMESSNTEIIPERKRALMLSFEWISCSSQISLIVFVQPSFFASSRISKSSLRFVLVKFAIPARVQVSALSISRTEFSSCSDIVFAPIYNSGFPMFSILALTKPLPYVRAFSYFTYNS